MLLLLAGSGGGGQASKSRQGAGSTHPDPTSSSARHGIKQYNDKTHNHVDKKKNNKARTGVGEGGLPSGGGNNTIFILRGRKGQQPCGAQDRRERTTSFCLTPRFTTTTKKTRRRNSPLTGSCATTSPSPDGHPPPPRPSPSPCTPPSGCRAATVVFFCDWLPLFRFEKKAESMRRERTGGSEGAYLRVRSRCGRGKKTNRHGTFSGGGHGQRTGPLTAAPKKK